MKDEAQAEQGPFVEVMKFRIRTWEECNKQPYMRNEVVTPTNINKWAYRWTLQFGNGEIGATTAIEGDSQQAIGVFRGLAIGAGSCVKISPTQQDIERMCWHDPEWDCYLQSEDERYKAYVLINPRPVTDL